MTVQECQASVRARRKKRDRRLVIAYALRSAIILLLVFMIVLMICGVLYIKEHVSVLLHFITGADKKVFGKNCWKF